MKKVCLLMAGFFASAFIYAQGITTASDYFKTVSDYYATIQDYEADINIENGSSLMSGRVSYKKPQMLRIDFANPEDQVILFNGDDLTIYLPGSSAILEQSVDSSGAQNNSATGLGLLRRYYTVQWAVGYDNVPLENGSDEMVKSLVLYRRSTTEAFNKIELFINPEENLIRRVIATTPQNEKFTFDIYNYSINKNLSDQRFMYDPPSSANNYNNFLFGE